MHIANILRILGLLLMPFSLTMIPPMIVALWYQEHTLPEFLYACFTTFILGLLLWLIFRKKSREVRAREGFLIVTLFWVALSFVGAFPFTFSENPHISWPDAIFETISGLTTTGATVLMGLDTMPRSIVYYRHQLQFIGGGGIILLGIAILPMLGVGGMQLFRAEVPGPFKDDKLTPRIAQTSKTLWYIYIGLTALCAIAFFLSGMSLFDAICHSFSAVSTGGFSTHDQNFIYFKNPSTHIVAIIFMILGAVNFSIHFTALREKSLKQYWADFECKIFLIVILIMSLVVSFTLIYYDTSKSIFDAVLQSTFQVTTFITTTGFASSYYGNWPTFVPILLVLLSLIGGSAGSTAGGIKMIRIIFLFKQVYREIQRLIHPSGHYLIKLGMNRLQPRTLDAIWGFLGLFLGCFTVLLLFLMATGLDFLTSFSALAACISSAGLGLGNVVDNFLPVSDAAKIILSVAMLAGRLEFFTLIVLITPSYWRN